MPRNPDAPADSECAIPLLTRRDALRRGLLLGLGTVVAASGCAGGGDDEEEDEGD